MAIASIESILLKSTGLNDEQLKALLKSPAKQTSNLGARLGERHYVVAVLFILNLGN